MNCSTCPRTVVPRITPRHVTTTPVEDRAPPIGHAHARWAARLRRQYRTEGSEVSPLFRLTQHHRAFAPDAALAACGGGQDDAEAPLPPQTRQRIDTLVAQQLHDHALPGAVIGVWIPGRGTMVAAYGTANLATGAPRDTDGPFRIASITKSFIGTAVLILADQGKLKTSDKLARWYPAFPKADQITVGDLLRMRSGIADSADPAFLAEYWNQPLLALNAEAMIARSAARGGEFITHDTVTRYNNLNFMLLERIVERSSGVDIRTFLRTEVFAPLHLSSTLYPSDSSLPGGLHGYGRAAASAPLQDRTVLNPLPAGGAGAMISTMRDLRAFGRALCRGDLLQAATQAERLRPTTLEGEAAIVGYGQGLARVGDFCGHNGTIFGFSSDVWYLPAYDAVIVVNVNRLDLDDASQSFGIFAALTQILFPELVDWQVPR